MLSNCLLLAHRRLKSPPASKEHHELVDSISLLSEVRGLWLFYGHLPQEEAVWPSLLDSEYQGDLQTALKNGPSRFFIWG